MEDTVYKARSMEERRSGEATIPARAPPPVYLGGLALEGAPTPAAPAGPPNAASAVACSRCAQLASPPLVLNCGHLCCRGCLAEASPLCPAANCGQRVQAQPAPCQLAISLMNAEVPSELVAAATAASAATTAAASAAASAAAAADAPSVDGGAAATAALYADNGTAAAAGGLYTHFRVGCDGCGAYPIVGGRWHCLDCPEAIGFDLCAECHVACAETALDGRFGQVHTAAHTMERQAEPTTWVHQLQASHPELSVHEIIRMAQLALSPGEGPGEDGEDGGPMARMAAAAAGGGEGGGEGGGAGFGVGQFEPFELETPGAAQPLAAAEAESTRSAHDALVARAARAREFALLFGRLSTLDPTADADTYMIGVNEWDIARVFRDLVAAAGGRLVEPEERTAPANVVLEGENIARILINGRPAFVAEGEEDDVLDPMAAMALAVAAAGGRLVEPGERTEPADVVIQGGDIARILIEGTEVYRDREDTEADDDDALDPMAAMAMAVAAAAGGRLVEPDERVVALLADGIAFTAVPPDGGVRREGIEGVVLEGVVVSESEVLHPGVVPEGYGGAVLEGVVVSESEMAAVLADGSAMAAAATVRYEGEDTARLLVAPQGPPLPVGIEGEDDGIESIEGAPPLEDPLRVLEDLQLHAQLGRLETALGVEDGVSPAAAARSPWSTVISAEHMASAEDMARELEELFGVPTPP